MERTIKRGDIFYADLNPVVGSEQGGRRPVLIISNDIGNRHSPTVIVAAITSRVHTKAKLPTHTAVNDFEGLDKDSIILLEQIRTIDKQRLKQHMGMMPENIMARVDKALAISISLNNRPNGKCAN
ncbi:type II toxin-antitoxin system PemK/MazF family toxin [Longicatena caecimuris]|uniref:type II toxin-antitoxin system PemK/MazF family toxin n=1 Tax=Longicatena caecimuris TaxID=1796635 RepID=UPI0022E8216D|nr:type II toxin-antitoxin system PemK/MazF family toxin [Longicatena caecimuris]